MPSAKLAGKAHHVEFGPVLPDQVVFEAHDFHIGDGDAPVGR